MGSRKAAALTLAASLALSGCALDLLRPSPGPNTNYDLTAPDVFPETLGSSAGQILVPAPQAVGVVATDRIAVRSDETVVTVLAGAQWQSTLPELLQSRLIEAFQRSGRIRGVGRPGDSILSNYQLLLDIRAFEVNSDLNIARIELFGRLMNDRTGRIIAMTRFTATEPLTDNDADGYVTALDAAFDRVAIEILAFTLARI